MGAGRGGQDADPHATRIPSARAGTTVSAVAAMLSDAVNACQRGAGLGLTATETMRPCGDGVCLGRVGAVGRSEEHTSELQSHSDIVCRLLLEKKTSARKI